MLTTAQAYSKACARKGSLRSIGAVGAVVGQHSVDLVGHGLDQGMQEVRGDAGGGFGMQLGEGEL